jgi:MarR-like DNA-binding transcriptional regulator SgrR of sgrS sRNA
MQTLNKDIKNGINNVINDGKYKLSKDNDNYILSSAGIENIPSFEINQVRYFHKGDEAIAVRIQKVLKEKGLELDVRYFDYKDISQAVPVGQLELWIDNVGNYEKKSEQPSAKR